jgi:hypothetical protein
MAISRMVLSIAAWIIVTGTICQPDSLAAGEDGDLCDAIRRAYLANLEDVVEEVRDRDALTKTRFVFRETRETLETELAPMVEASAAKMLLRLGTSTRTRTANNSDDLAVAGLWRDTLGLVILPNELIVYASLEELRGTVRLLEGADSPKSQSKGANDLPRLAGAFLARYIASYQLLARGDMAGPEWPELVLEEIAWRRCRWEILSFLRASSPASEDGLDCHLGFLRISMNQEGLARFPYADEARSILLELSAQLSRGRRQWREVSHWLEGLREMPLYEQFPLPDGGEGYAFRPPLPGPPIWSGSFDRAVAEVAEPLYAEGYLVVPGAFGRAIAGVAECHVRPLRADGVWIMSRTKATIRPWSHLRLSADEWVRVDVVDLFPQDASKRMALLRKLREQPVEQLDSDNNTMRWRPETAARCWSSDDTLGDVVELRRLRWPPRLGKLRCTLTVLRGSLMIEARFEVREGSRLASSLPETLLRLVKSVDQPMALALVDADLL